MEHSGKNDTRSSAFSLGIFSHVEQLKKDADALKKKKKRCTDTHPNNSQDDDDPNLNL